jgi:hypothetical protein
MNLTDGERVVLDRLAEAWNAFTVLGNYHPDDHNEMRAAIHQAQNIIATRVARRVDPDIWTQPNAIHPAKS